MLIVQHPGPPDPRRWLTMPAAPQAIHVINLAAGEDLLTSIKAYLIQCHGNGAWFRLMKGEISTLQLMTGKPGDAPIVAAFSGPHDIACPAIIEAGTGNIGAGIEGTLTSHCHAVFRDRRGSLVGGHLIEGTCVAGPRGIEVEIGILSGAHFVQKFDAETGFTLFYPGKASGSAEASIVVKLQPNQDLTVALEMACKSTGVQRARIRSAVGSLSEAALVGDTGESILVAGPGLEVAGLSGEVSLENPADPAPLLCGYVCQASGAAVGGRLLRGRNPICVTFELVLERLN